MATLASRKRSDAWHTGGRGPRAPRIRCLLAVGVVLLAGGALGPAAEQDATLSTNREYAIKAAYLYQFGRYVQWPAASFADSRSPVVIGVLRHSPVSDVLEEIARTKQIEGRPISIQRFASVADYKPCHILFVSAAAGPEQTAAAIERVKNSPVLLVGEEPGFAQQGGIINFVREDNTIRFEVNADAARQWQLKISSKLLSLATIVNPGKPGIR